MGSRIASRAAAALLFSLLAAVASSRPAGSGPEPDAPEVAAVASSRPAGSGPEPDTPEPAAAPFLEAIRDLLRGGRHAEAETAARNLLREVEGAHGPESEQAAAVLDIVVESLWRGGRAKSPDALAMAGRAIRIRETIQGGDHPDTARSVTYGAIVLKEQGDYAGARPLFERALAIRERALGPDHPVVAEGLSNLAGLLMRMGDYRAARPLYDRALAIREAAFGSEHYDVARSLNNLGLLLWNIGDYETARPLYERALGILEKTAPPDHPNVARGLSNLALLLWNMGDYAGARPLYERALGIFEKALGPDSGDVARNLNYLALLLGSTGDYVGARPLYERAIAILEKAHGPDHPYLAQTLGDLAILLRDGGDPDGARPLFERARAIQLKSLGPDHPDLARTLNALALLHWRQDAYDEARALYERALAIRVQALGPDHPYVAESQNNLGVVLQAVGEIDRARSLFEETLALRERILGPDHPAVAETLEALAETLAEGGDLRGAFEISLRAETIGREHLRLTARSLAERQALRYASVRTSGLGLALSIAAGSDDPSTVRKAWDLAIRSRGVVLDEMAARHGAVRAAADPRVARLAVALDAARRRLATLTVRGPGDDPPDRHRSLLDQARIDKESAERALAAQSDVFRREQGRARIGLEEVARALPRDGALVAYCLYDRWNGNTGRTARTTPSYLAFVLGPGQSTPVLVPLGAAAPIESAIAEWRGRIETAPPVVQVARRRAEADYRRSAAALRRVLWDPIAAHLGDAKRAYVVPDGAAALVSLDTLAVDDRFLAETSPLVHYLSAERDLVRGATAAGDGRGIFLVGGPDFDALEAPSAPAAGRRREPEGDGSPYRGQQAQCGDFGSMRFAPLPASRVEADEIAALWLKGGSTDHAGDGEVLKLTGRRADEASVKRLAKGHRVVHLATHGFFLDDRCPSALGGRQREKIEADAALRPVPGDNPLLLTGLALAGANRRTTGKGPEEGEDGILTAEEIASLDLSGVEWVVLSACHTGIGKVQAGEGVLGLRRAVEVAGAKSLIMSLWRVDDQAARRWMRRLYEGRLAGLSTADAIRRANLETLAARRRAGHGDHPHYWGAFVATGDWR